MKIFISVIVCLILVGGVALAASIDGKWVSERKGERNGQAWTMTQTFDLKADGNKLTGKVTIVFGEMEPRTTEIKDGKVDGNKFSFATVMAGRDGAEMKMVYEGTVEGDSLKGNVAREGADPRPFEAKRR